MDARDKALKEGQLQAFSKLMKRLVLSEDLDYLPNMPVVETNEVFTQSESTYEGFTLNTQKLYLKKMNKHIKIF